MRRILIASVLALAAAIASSCGRCDVDCQEGGLSPDLLFPADGASDVATNTRVWLGGWRMMQSGIYDASDLVLSNDQGTAVPVRRTELRGVLDRLHVLSPEAPLAAGTRYELRHGSPRTTLSTFTTGAQPDSKVPDRPRASVTANSTSGLLNTGVCDAPGGEHHASLEAAGRDAFVFVLRWDAPEPFPLDSAAPSSGEAFSPQLVDLSTDGALRVGRGYCVHNWPEAAPGAAARAHVASFDAAGNFSGWSEAIEIRIPPFESCAHAGGAGATALPGLLAGVRRSRRRLPGRSASA